jgi:hypothetical protein
MSTGANAVAAGTVVCTAMPSAVSASTAMKPPCGQPQGVFSHPERGMTHSADPSATLTGASPSRWWSGGAGSVPSICPRRTSIPEVLSHTAWSSTVPAGARMKGSRSLAGSSPSRLTGGGRAVPLRRGAFSAEWNTMHRDVAWAISAPAWSVMSQLLNARLRPMWRARPCARTRVPTVTGRR